MKNHSEPYKNPRFYNKIGLKSRHGIQEMDQNPELKMNKKMDQNPSYGKMDQNLKNKEKEMK